MAKIGVYILQCANNRYYIGSTNNLDRRLFEQQTKQAKATENITPVNLVFFQKCRTLKEARDLEIKLKNKKSRKIIAQIINDGFIKFAGL